MMALNGARFGGRLLNSLDNRLRVAADLDGDGRDELLLSSPWGIEVLALAGRALTCPMLSRMARASADGCSTPPTTNSASTET
jgi:hypothetical protein